jgi:hypothetical protein
MYMVKKADFMIEKENISSESEEDHKPDIKNEDQETVDIPEPNNEKPKRKYKFTQARADALAKGREMRKQKIQANKEQLAELKTIKEKEKLNILAEKVKEINLSTSAKPKKIKKNKLEPIAESDSSSDSDQQIIVRRRKKKKKKKKIIYIDSSESEDENQRNPSKQVKFNYHDRYF